ncbi:choline monooxygenase; ring hydroxylating dioxygenase alpha subunit motif [Bacillus sp. OxB-1]|uniref:aromatic ring-hydroxylating oxygenase subunit alpha n=1 Tax=Bacillus sp. (strain OxB-1) TaxID=98228 RepID=UPI0005821FD0|nr:aromatic ring-hydroxylating dioxygenase subunit alpha [Bacillus sp. OxB-1]BAQ11645.1 choline monooxygenase; ring hydroxylating dioxygenase alpha subunit motif [Bacillus sp. OxB-1]
MRVTEKRKLFPHRYNSSVDISYTLPAPYYKDPGIFELEKEEIFYKNWVLAGHVEKVKEVGDYFTFNVQDQELFVIRGKDNKIRAFYNVCSHRGHELVKGSGNVKAVITCPYHAWTYKTDGKFNAGRGTNEIKKFNPEEACLKPAKVEIFASFIFINLDTKAKSLQDLMPGVEDDILKKIPEVDKLTLHTRLEYHVKGNWKAAIDNYLECNHCQANHPGFCQTIDVKNYQIEVFEYHSTNGGPLLINGESAYSVGDSPEHDQYEGWFLWPTTTFGYMPGEPQLILFHFVPTGPDTVIEYFDFYFLDKEMTPERKEVLEFFDKTLQPEDITLIESVQRGFSSNGYYDGRYVGNDERTDISEHALHHFHGLVLKSLGAL